MFFSVEGGDVDSSYDHDSSSSVSTECWGIVTHMVVARRCYHFPD